MQNLNQRSHKQKRRLRRKRRQSQRLVAHCCQVLLKAALSTGSMVYFEWPSSATGWHLPELARLREELAEGGQDTYTFIVHGCAFGLQSLSSPGRFLRKSWRILTTDPGFGSVARMCPKNHRHVAIQGRDTAHSAFYPKALCHRVARHWLEQ